MKVLMMTILIGMTFVLSAAQSVVPYGTHIVKGTFKGDYNTVLWENTTAKVRLQRADGTVISESSVLAANGEGVNFILEVPVASQSTASACVVGEVLDAALIVGKESIVVPACLKVDTPLKVGMVSVNCTEVKSFTNPKDGTLVKIPVVYLDEVQSYLEAGQTYDPWADYDHDGHSNYEEFLAGTIPFDETDYLKIMEFEKGVERLRLKFESVGGHVYAVSSKDALAHPEWMARKVRKSADGEEIQQILGEGEDGAPGVAEIFITPVADKPSEFFKLEAK